LEQEETQVVLELQQIAQVAMAAEQVEELVFQIFISLAVQAAILVKAVIVMAEQVAQMVKMNKAVQAAAAAEQVERK
jgi:hypothetical protein